MLSMYSKNSLWGTVSVMHVVACCEGPIGTVIEQHDSLEERKKCRGGKGRAEERKYSKE